MTIELDRAAAECGGSVTGTAAWSGAGSADVILRWSTSGDGIVDGGTTEAAVIADGQARFELPVPHDGPMSFEGKLISVRWEVVLEAGDTTETAEVTVLPRGGLAMWVRQAAPPPQT